MRFIAHRGCPYKELENTIESCKKYISGERIFKKGDRSEAVLKPSWEQPLCWVFPKCFNPGSSPVLKGCIIPILQTRNQASAGLGKLLKAVQQ